MVSETDMPPVPTLIEELVDEKLDSFRKYLAKNRDFLSTHADFETFIDRYIHFEHLSKVSPSPKSRDSFKQYKASMALLGRASDELRRVLWGHKIYLSGSVVEQLAFNCATRQPNKDFAEAFFEFVVQRGLHRPGFVLYPIHGFGILGAGLFKLIGARRPRIDFREAGIMMATQSNSAAETMAFLNDVREAFDISAAIPQEFSADFASGAPSWLTRNPLIAVRMTSVTSGYYQNQLIIVVRLRSASAIVLMVAALIREGDALNSQKYFSSASINNNQTLNIRHYMVFEGWTEELEVLRVPMNIDRTELTALSDMSVDVDPSMWSRPENRALLDRVQTAVHTVEGEYIDAWILGDHRSTKAKLMRKLFLSMGYFQRSFRGALQQDEAAVALAVAFETLLTDGYGRGGPKKRVARRTRICLTGNCDAIKLASSVDQLMEYRGQVVHEGASEINVDFESARKAYVYAFLRVAENAKLLGDGTHNSIGDLLGDKPPRDTALKSFWKRLRNLLGSDS